MGHPEPPQLYYRLQQHCYAIQITLSILERGISDDLIVACYLLLGFQAITLAHRGPGVIIIPPAQEIPR